MKAYKISVDNGIVFSQGWDVPEETGTSAVVERLEFEEFDHLAQAARDWDLRLQKLGADPFWGRLDQVILGRVRVSRARFGSALLQEGSSPPGMRTFGVPVLGSEHYQWRNRRVTPELLLLFPREGEFQSISGSGFDSYPISVTPDYLDKVAGDLGIAEQRLSPEGEVMRPRTRDLAALRAHIRRVLDLASQGTPLDEPGVPGVIEEEMTELLVRTLAGAESIRPPRMRLRDQAIRKAEEVIHAVGTEPLRVRDLCSASEASWRTLDYAFQEKYGIAVKRYMTIRRLNGVHRDLLRGDDRTTVSGVAARWNFWHMGELAARYRQLFGELPSETLKRARGQLSGQATLKN